MSYNLWQDEKNERGLWRRMTRKDYLAAGIHGKQC
jgi:prolyl oligopeptidase PreP (S9A serine peptidase family)